MIDGRRRLLLPVDGSSHAERAARYVAQYAALSPSEIVVLHAQGAESFAIESAHGNELAVDLHEVGMKATRRVRALLDDARLPYRLHTELGDPADIIARFTEVEDIDEVIMGSRGLGQWKGLVVGSVAYGVIHRVAVPVTIVGAAPEGELAPPAPALQRLLLAVDGSEHALHAVEYVCGLHRSGIRLEVELLHVPTPVPAGYVRRFVSRDMIEGYYRDQGESACYEAKELLQSEGVTFNVHTAAGHVAQKISQFACERQCTRIAMGTRGLGAASGLVLGSVAYQVVHLAPLPVTLVK